MIHLYYWNTPNGRKIPIFLEEAGLPYKIHPINIAKEEQFAAEFLKISPNNKIPAIVDDEPADGGKPLSVFESGAILWYLAEKSKKFIPESARGKILVSEWLFWQVGGLGPMSGQSYHFTNSAKEKIPYAMERYANETARLYGVLNKQLESHEWVAGEYSIADMAIYPWIEPYKMLGQNLDSFPHIKDWIARMAERPAVIRTYRIEV